MMQMLGWKQRTVSKEAVAGGAEKDELREPGAPAADAAPGSQDRAENGRPGGVRLSPFFAFIRPFLPKQAYAEMVEASERGGKELRNVLDRFERMEQQQFVIVTLQKRICESLGISTGPPSADDFPAVISSPEGAAAPECDDVA